MKNTIKKILEEVYDRGYGKAPTKIDAAVDDIRNIIEGCIPKYKKQDWQSTDHNTVEVTGYNQAIADIKSNLDKIWEVK